MYARTPHGHGPALSVSTSANEQGATRSNGRSWWKLIPGFAISAFFLWRTLRAIRLDRLHSLRLVHPLMLLAALLFIAAGYSLRAYRWWCMLRRSHHPKYGACFRILFTSLAANNFLPFRIGDFMRIFAYAGDVNASSSTVLSTVILERLLDICGLLVFLVASLWGAASQLPPVPLHGGHISVLRLAEVLLVPASLGLGLLLFGTRALQAITNAVVQGLPSGPRTEKMQHWALLLFDAVLHLTFLERLWLLALTGGAWLLEGFNFVSCEKMIGLQSGPRGPWVALAFSNLSFLLPSAPGGIGPFELTAKMGMQSQGTPAADAAIYAVLVHVIVFVSITLVGGIAFVLHRAHRKALGTPIAEDLAALPTEMP